LDRRGADGVMTSKHFADSPRPNNDGVAVCWIESTFIVGCSYWTTTKHEECAGAASLEGTTNRLLEMGTFVELIDANVVETNHPIR
jgi:hypothetical protein